MNSQAILQCMGGWCSVRERCSHYHAEPLFHVLPVERICGKVEEPESLLWITRNPAPSVDNSQC